MLGFAQCNYLDQELPDNRLFENIQEMFKKTETIPGDKINQNLPLLEMKKRF